MSLGGQFRSTQQKPNLKEPDIASIQSNLYHLGLVGGGGGPKRNKSVEFKTLDKERGTETPRNFSPLKHQTLREPNFAVANSF